MRPVAEVKRVDLPEEWRDLHRNLNDLLTEQLRNAKSERDRSRAGHDYDNQPMCQVCWGRGDLLRCDADQLAHSRRVARDDRLDLPRRSGRGRVSTGEWE